MPNFDHDYFEELYREDVDPWRFRTSGYEDEKYTTTMSVLSGSRYKKCLELGCSIGVLTQRLITCCDAVVAVDTSEQALAEARKTCVHPTVRFQQHHLPNGHLGCHYDLIVASEILYYFDAMSLRRLASRLITVANPGALFISVHWTGATDYPLAGDKVAQICFNEARLETIRSEIHPKFRLDVGRFPRLWPSAY